MIEMPLGHNFPGNDASKPDVVHYDEFAWHPSEIVLPGFINLSWHRLFLCE